MLRPMVLLAIGIAILDDHTRLACLETDYTFPHLAAALGAAVGRIAKMMKVHVVYLPRANQAHDGGGPLKG